MNEIMDTEEMEHVQQDRDISDVMHKRDAERARKVDDAVRAEAAQYNAHLKWVRSMYHKASHAAIFVMGIGVAFMATSFYDSNIYALLGATVFTASMSCLNRMFIYMSTKKKGV